MGRLCSHGLSGLLWYGRMFLSLGCGGGVPHSVQCGACWISPLCRTVRRIWRFLVVVCPKGGAKFDRGVVCTGFPFVI